MIRPLTREDMVKLCREAVTGVNRPSYCKNPVSFDPHDWVLEAVGAAHRRGVADGQLEISERRAAPQTVKVVMHQCEICNKPTQLWMVNYIPGRYSSMQVSIVDAMAHLAYRIATCGGYVCVFRAKHHGVPGRTYKEYAE